MAEEQDENWVGAQCAFFSGLKTSAYRLWFLIVDFSWEKHKGNMYDVDVYQWLSDPSNCQHDVKQSQGDGNWTDFLQLCQNLSMYRTLSFSEFYTMKLIPVVKDKFHIGAVAAIIQYGPLHSGHGGRSVWCFERRLH